ncbi:MAG: hemerythrin domain-containing protein [Rhizobiales bacterium]|nr:hemerythrin domain-containing protein [Hyphomicrobiales bacterium]
MSNIYEQLKQDHDVHRDLLARLESTEGDSSDRRELWDRFYYDVKSHAAAEEETFYSKLMQDPKGQDDARHGVAEHKELDDIMEELHQMDFSSPGWLTRFKTLKHEYEHHMDEEEEDMFAKGRSVFSSADAKEFGAHFASRKQAERRLVDEKASASLEE